MGVPVSRGGWLWAVGCVPWVLSLTSCSFGLTSVFHPVNHVAVARCIASTALAENFERSQAAAVSGRMFLTLDQCRTMAIRNNLGVQVARQEEITNKQRRYKQQAGLLPNVTVRGELSERDNEMFGYSELLGDEGIQVEQVTRDALRTQVVGIIPYLWAIGRDRFVWRYSAEIKWSPTRAAVAYYSTKSAYNDRIAAHYDRVRKVQEVLGKVDGAYWRLTGFRQALPLAHSLVSRRSEIVSRKEALFRERVLEVDDYQESVRYLVAAQGKLDAIVSEAERQANILVASMAVSSDKDMGTDFVLLSKLPRLPVSPPVHDLEMIAAQNRPEILAAVLTHFNAQNEVTKAKLRYFPEVSGFWRYNRDNDKHLRENDWKEYGFSLNFDVLGLISNIPETFAAESERDKTQTQVKQIVEDMLQQVRDLRIRYAAALDKIHSSRRQIGVQSALLRAIAVRAKAGSVEKLRKKDAEARLLEARIDLLTARGEAAAALAEMNAATGVNFNEPAPAD